VFNVESGDLFGRALTGLRELPINVIATLGRGLDPRRFGPQPAHVRIASYIPQSLVLPHCDLVVSHGGSGTVLGALTAGVPSLVLPMGGDQPHNAARCEALGVGLRLDAVGATAETIGERALAMLGEPAYRAAAERIRAETRACPDRRTRWTCSNGSLSRRRDAAGHRSAARGRAGRRGWAARARGRAPAEAAAGRAPAGSGSAARASGRARVTVGWGARA
jgi:hypothetical protein